MLIIHYIIAKQAAESPGVFPETRDLQYEVLLWLQVELCDRLANSSLQLRISLSGHVQLREKVTDESQEYWHVAGHNLGQVEVPQRSHQHLRTKMVFGRREATVSVCNRICLR